MAKSKAAKHKPPAASKAGAGASSLRAHAPLVALAIIAQLLLTWGYFAYGSGATPPQSTPESPAVPARTVAAKCPDEWPACPPVSGADWEALARLEAEAVPTEDEVAACDPPGLLSPQQVPGMHLICVLPATDADDLVGTRLAVYTEMRKGRDPQLVLLPPKLGRVEHLLAVLEHKLKLKPRVAPYQQSAVFSDKGFRLTRGMPGQRLAKLGRALLMEGGQWIWPPGEVGHVHELPGLTAPDVTTRVVTLSLKPLVVEVENFLSTEEAEHIIARARPHMEKSGVALKDVDIGKAAKEFRTSSQYFLPTANDNILERVDERVQYLTRIPINHAEYIQVLNYQHLEHYSAHHDFFNPREYANNPQMLREVENGAKNRLATVFFYLNNVSSGGETNFPRAQTKQWPQGGPVPRDYFDCSTGLSVFPQEGKVIIFYSMLPNGQMDEFSLHGGCDVLDKTAQKWSANFWLWNKPYHFSSSARKRQTQALQAKWL